MVRVSASGLEGIVVAETALSEVDGEAGRLVIGDRPVEDLAGHVSFEDVCGLLWEGAMPDAARREALRARIGEGRRRAGLLLPGITLALALPDGMDALRAAVAHVHPAHANAANEIETFADLAGAAAVFAAAWARVRQGLAPVPPDPSLPLAEDFLRMVRGGAVPRPLVDALDAYLVTVSDHGLNASTFAARVVTSTGSDPVSAVVAAIGALKGPLHGGAPGPVLDMLDAIWKHGGERVDETIAEAWIEGEMKAGRRIMGMGHRIYRTRDPRAAVLERAASALEAAGHATTRLALTRAVERAAEGALRKKYPDRPLRANVELYTAVLLDAVGLPRELFSPTFAVGRAAGWCAHISEQRRAGKLIRPASRYVGAAAIPAPSNATEISA